MKIDLNTINRDHFLVQEKDIGGEKVYLVNPNGFNTVWDKDNLIFRSSILDSQGNLCSAGFKKFFNHGEKTEIVATPLSLNDCSILEKVDGSCLIVSYWHGNLIARTRGTVDATKFENGYEINLLKEKYPKAFDNELLKEESYSFIYEWTSPLNKIVIDYKTLDIKLIGVISHSDYSLATQDKLDEIAEEIGVARPKRYIFGNLAEMLESVKNLEGQEGFCLYSPDGQSIIKCKSDWYLKLHRFKANLSFNNTADLFFEWDCPNNEEFKEKLIKAFDHECYELVKIYADKVLEVYARVESEELRLIEYVKVLKGLLRKDFAAKIKQENPDKMSYCFAILDKEELNHKERRKLFDIYAE